jgi:hypothetical protein
VQVEVQRRSDQSQVLYVHVDGVTVLRIQGIGRLRTGRATTIGTTEESETTIE